MRKLTVIIVIAFLFAGSGCAREEKPAIIIGDIRISAKDFDSAFRASIYAGVADAATKRGDFLETFISRKLLLKEAEELGLDRDVRFLQSIQLFWEQSLLKLTLANKIKQLAVGVQVDEREIEEYYQRHKEVDYADKPLSEVYEQIKMSLFRQKQNQAVEDWVVSLRNNTKIDIDYGLLGIKAGE
ncbi:hypothetical protein ACFL1D_05690 [Candidatus Omnitrophota bacterium]